MKLSRFYIGVFTLAVIALLAGSTAAAVSGVTWTRSEYLSRGQGSVESIQVNCGSELILNSPYGAAFDLYAMRNYDQSGSCPGPAYIRTHYDKVSVSNGRTSYLSLEPGTWCISVYSRYGSGQYFLESTNSCLVPPSPVTDPCLGDHCCDGNCPPVCGPYKTDVKDGYLSQGDQVTTGYYIPGDRSYIEWILTGSCGEEIIPMEVMSAGDAGTMDTRHCGTDFDLSIYQNHNPRNIGGYADYADTGTGSGAYIGVSNPRPGTTYYAQVYAKNGSGHYTLTCRSYTCRDEVVMMMNQDMAEMVNPEVMDTQPP